jgi:hypothetical protein
MEVLSRRVSAAMALDSSAMRRDCSAMLVLVSALRMLTLLSDWLMILSAWWMLWHSVVRSLSQGVMRTDCAELSLDAFSDDKTPGVQAFHHGLM